MKRWTGIFLLLTLAACAPSPTAQPQAITSPTPTAAAVRATPTNMPLPPEPTPAAEGTPTLLPALPPEPQRIDFQAEDGELLVGTYYPAAVNPAPVVVLMHWAPGDQNDWVAIAPWLQNRGLTTGSTDKGTPWLDPSWFPALPEGRSFAVFTFTFRGCEGGCSSFDREGWLLDARAAMRTVRELPGIDLARIAAVGASIGADGAVDACEEGCVGAFSLSPGGYLTIPYADAVATVDAAGVPVRCLAAEGDGESAQACRSASGTQYGMEIYPSSEHGMALIQPTITPDVLEMLVAFLEQVME
ncbi:MAG: hypothetical protein RBT47_05280 [Anaerolineae bacterium]|jgi:dienelactone hydrolase|nr:hypothetical protein [Anaerolineae bacterium]